jgi:hypothetical protein
MYKLMARVLRVGLPSCAVVLLSACGPGPSTVINYHQVGACNGMPVTTGGAPTTTVFAGGNAAFVIFQVESVDNSKMSTAFSFDPTQLYIKDTPDRFLNPNSQVANVLANFNLVPTMVPAGKSLTLDGYGVTTVSTTTSDGAVEANKTSYFLNESGQSSSVVMNKTNSSQTTWTYTQNCLDITLH